MTKGETRITRMGRISADLGCGILVISRMDRCVRGESASLACGMGTLSHERITRAILGSFFEVYNILGFGFLESLYAAALERELRDRGHDVARELLVRVSYKGEELGVQRLDMVVDQVVVVEIKSTFALHRAARRQLLSYLHSTQMEVGLLLHFGPEAKFERVVSSNTRAHPR